MNKRKSIRGLFLAGAMMGTVVLLAGCRSADPASVAQLPPTATTTLPTETPPEPSPASTETRPAADTATVPLQATETPVAPTQAPSSPATESEATSVVALTDLAQRLGVPAQDIVVLSVEAVDWPDGSLGCPQPGMIYAQMITPGYRVLLEVGGQVYEIHTDRGRTVVLCDEEGVAMIVPPVSGTVEPGLGPFVAMATEDLAGRLAIAEGEIEVLEAIAVVWPDASLGCPQPGMAYRQIPMDGTLIRLQFEGKVFEYHSGGGRDPFLCEQPLTSQKDTPPQIDLLGLTPGPPDN